MLLKINLSHSEFWEQKLKQILPSPFMKTFSSDLIKRGSTRKSSIFYIGRHLEIFDPLFFQLHSNARQKLGHRPKFYVLKLNP